jgi:nicotinate-nucleotide pyrophosphorylase (carboxylating)
MVKPHYLNPEAIRQFISQALHEDVGDGDHSSLAAVPAHARNRARLIIKDNGILAGIELAQSIFAEVDPGLQVQLLLADSTQ